MEHDYCNCLNTDPDFVTEIVMVPDQAEAPPEHRAHLWFCLDCFEQWSLGYALTMTDDMGNALLNLGAQD